MGVLRVALAAEPAAAAEAETAPVLPPRFERWTAAELEPTLLSSEMLQWRLGARAGFQFSTHDGFAQVACDARLPCSRVVIEPFAAVTLFQWVRGQLGFD